MIKTTKQAKAVQQRRFNAQKRGTAKAVRRFYKVLAPKDYKAHMCALPVIW